MFDITGNGLISNLVYGCVNAIVIVIASRIFAHFRRLSKKAVEKEYYEYIQFKDNPQDLTNLFLEKIAQSLALAAFWAFSMLIYSSPVWAVTHEVKKACAFFLTMLFSCLIIYALSKPINIRYAITHPEKFKARVKMKLGALPDERVRTA